MIQQPKSIPFFVAKKWSTRNTTVIHSERNPGSQLYLQQKLLYIFVFFWVTFIPFKVNAAIPDQNGTYWGCLKKSTGTLRIISNPATSCKTGETKINWDQKGNAATQGLDSITDLAQLNQTKCVLNEVQGKISLSYTPQGLAQLSITKGQAVCGDGIVGIGEQCDDGNSINGDGCSQCLTDAASTCGDGVKSGTEQCDDGNSVNGDGCSQCLTDTASTCGDGVKNGNEQCDDGNSVNGDGCSAICQSEVK